MNLLIIIYYSRIHNQFAIHQSKQFLAFVNILELVCVYEQHCLQHVGKVNKHTYKDVCLHLYFFGVKLI